MITVIDKKEIMTLRELKEKYATKWFRYVIVDETESIVGESESIMCYALYTADTEDELYSHPDPDRHTRRGGVATGDNVVFPMEIGGIYVHA